MQLILDHVKSYGYFEPPQFKGGYDILPFTHEEYHAYVKTLQKQRTHVRHRRKCRTLVKSLCKYF